MISPKIESPKDAGFLSSDENNNTAYWRFNTAHNSNDPNKTSIPALTGNLPSATMNLTEISFFVNNSSSTNTTGVDVQSDIKLTFDQPVYLGTGVIALGDQQIDVETAEGLTIKVAGSTVILNPTVDFDPGETVSVTIPGTAIRGYCEYYAGSTFSFTTTGPSITVTDGASGTGSSPSDIEVNFNEQCTQGSGGLFVYDSSDTLIATIPNDSNALEFIEVD
jgi:hypothetical protein